MKISNGSKRLMPLIAGKLRGLTEPVVRELEGAKPPSAAGAAQPAKAKAVSGKFQQRATASQTLTGWSTEDLMAAVREIIKSGRAVARGRFLNLRI